MRHPILILTALLAGVAAAPVTLTPRGHQHRLITLATTKTGKERLSTKGTDEQRINDCKVPPAQRTKRRPAECARPH
jgi:hypothetical protein